jgi:hypothetical protein
MISFLLPINWNKGSNTAINAGLNTSRIITGARNDLYSSDVDATVFELTRQITPGSFVAPDWLYIGRLVHAVKRNGGSLDYTITAATDSSFTSTEDITGTVNLADLEPNGDFFLPISFSLSPGTYQNFKVKLEASADMRWELGKIWLGEDPTFPHSPLWGRSIKRASTDNFTRGAARVFEIEYQGINEQQRLYLTTEVKPLADICQMLMNDQDGALVRDLEYLPGVMSDFRIRQINNISWNVTFDFIEAV